MSCSRRRIKQTGGRILPHVMVIGDVLFESVAALAELVEDKAVDPADEAPSRDVSIDFVLPAIR